MWRGYFIVEQPDSWGKACILALSICPEWTFPISSQLTTLTWGKMKGLVERLYLRICDWSILEASPLLSRWPMLSSSPTRLGMLSWTLKSYAMEISPTPILIIYLSSSVNSLWTCASMSVVTVTGLIVLCWLGNNRGANCKQQKRATAYRRTQDDGKFSIAIILIRKENVSWLLSRVACWVISNALNWFKTPLIALFCCVLGESWSPLYGADA